ncbi:ATP-binding protein [Staphylococcus aureus]|nr:ATP-binding protein [Staphylococcus aureus]
MNIDKINQLTNGVYGELTSKDMTCWRVTVDDINHRLFIHDIPEGYIAEKRTFFNDLYLKKSREIVRAYLPFGYRLKPQNEVEYIDNKLVIYFESSDSKQLDANEIIAKDYKIPLMKNVNWLIDKQPHALITGVTGSGKSMMLKYLFKCFLDLDSDIYVIDPKNADLVNVSKRYLNAHYIAVDKKDAICLLEELCEEMELRQNLMSKYSHRDSTDAYKESLRPIVLFYDELAALSSQLTTKDEKDKYNSCLKNLILKGRSAGINVILSMQKPLSQNVPTEIRDQCSFRLVLGRSTPKDTRRLVFGTNDTSTVIINNEKVDNDEWEEGNIAEYGGWYSLPDMKEPYDIFEKI